MILPFDDLVNVVADLHSRNLKIILCHGVFDLLHIGHIRHFEAAKRQGNILIVTITPDRHVGKGPNRPVFDESLRAQQVAALECVDYVAINKWPIAVEAIKLLKPDVYAKGSDYKERDLTGEIQNEEEAVKSIGGQIHFTDEITFSSTELLNANFGVYPEEARDFLKDFRKRYTADEIIERMKGLKRLKVLVIGDTIIDQYCYVETLGKSPKDNIITTKYLEEESFAGGVLAAANHLAGFCDTVHLVTCLGTNNDYGDFVAGHLKENITARFFHRTDAPTVVKRRFVDPAFLSKMFEIAEIDDRPLPKGLDLEICYFLKSVIGDFDLVLVTDFGHGMVSDGMIEVLCKKAKFLAVNTQTNSANMGFNLITKYPRADYVCLDEQELRLACHNKFGEIRNLISWIETPHNALSSKLIGFFNIAVTLGHHGSITYSTFYKTIFCEIPALSTKVVDRTGAGDAYLAVTAPCVADLMPMDLVGFIGNAAGALKVQIVGNRESVEPVPLYKFITALLK